MLICGLDWAKEQFHKTPRENQRICIVLGDLNFYWPSVTYERIKGLTQDGITVIGLSTGDTEHWKKETGCQVIDVGGALRSSSTPEDFIVNMLDCSCDALFL